MFHQCDYLVRPRPGVFDCQIVAIDFEELHPCDEASALVSLGESMRPRDPGHQRHCQDSDVLFAKPEKLRPRAKALSSNPRSRRRCGSPVIATTARSISTTASIDSHLGSFGKGGQYLWKPLDDLLGQHLVVDFAFNRAGTQNHIGRPPLRRQLEQLFAGVAI
jgi:hypothetical protein